MLEIGNVEELEAEIGFQAEEVEEEDITLAQRAKICEEGGRRPTIRSTPTTRVVPRSLFQELQGPLKVGLTRERSPIRHRIAREASGSPTSPIPSPIDCSPPRSAQRIVEAIPLPGAPHHSHQPLLRSSPKKKRKKRNPASQKKKNYRSKLNREGKNEGGGVGRRVDLAEDRPPTTLGDASVGNSYLDWVKVLANAKKGISDLLNKGDLSDIDEDSLESFREMASHAEHMKRLAKKKLGM